VETATLPCMELVAHICCPHSMDIAPQPGVSDHSMQSSITPKQASAFVVQSVAYHAPTDAQLNLRVSTTQVGATGLA
jgi:hypothetical protein